MTKAVEIPTIAQDLKEQLKAERLQFYVMKIYQTQMDIAAYDAVNDTVRLKQSKIELQNFIEAYHAVAVM